MSEHDMLDLLREDLKEQGKKYDSLAQAISDMRVERTKADAETRADLTAQITRTKDTLGECILNVKKEIVSLKEAKDRVDEMCKVTLPKMFEDIRTEVQNIDNKVGVLEHSNVPSWFHTHLSKIVPVILIAIGSLIGGGVGLIWGQSNVNAKQDVVIEQTRNDVKVIKDNDKVQDELLRGHTLDIRDCQNDIKAKHE